MDQSGPAVLYYRVEAVGAEVRGAVRLVAGRQLSDMD